MADGVQPSHRLGSHQRIDWQERYRAAQADVAAAPPDTLAILNDYSDGVNAYIAGKSGPDLAVQYSILAIKGINIPIEKSLVVHLTLNPSPLGGEGLSNTA